MLWKTNILMTNNKEMELVRRAMSQQSRRRSPQKFQFSLSFMERHQHLRWFILSLTQR